MTDFSSLNLPIRQSQVPEALRPEIDKHAYNNPSQMMLVMSNHLVNNTPWFIPLQRFDLTLPKREVYSGFGFNGQPSTTYFNTRGDVSVRVANMARHDIEQMYKTIQDHMHAMIQGFNSCQPYAEYKNKGFLCFQQNDRWSIEAELHGLIITDLEALFMSYDYGDSIKVKLLYDYANPYLPSYKHPEIEQQLKLT